MRENAQQREKLINKVLFLYLLNAKLLLRTGSKTSITRSLLGDVLPIPKMSGDPERDAISRV